MTTETDDFLAAVLPAYVEGERAIHNGDPAPRKALNGYGPSVGRALDSLPVDPFAVWVDELIAFEVPDRGRPFGDELSSRASCTSPATRSSSITASASSRCWRISRGWTCRKGSA